MNRFKRRTKTSHAALARDIRRARYEDGLHNHKGQGALPSWLGWGQHRPRKAEVTLFNPWRKP